MKEIGIKKRINLKNAFHKCCKWTFQYLIYNIIYLRHLNSVAVMSVGWDVKWCPVPKITMPLARKRSFLWISSKNRLVRSARKTLTFHNLSFT